MWGMDEAPKINPFEHDEFFDPQPNTFDDADFQNPRALVSALDLKMKDDDTSSDEIKLIVWSCILESALEERNINLCSFKDEYGWTALHVAVYEDKLQVAKILLGFAGNNKIKLLIQETVTGITAFEWAVCKERYDIGISLIVQAGDEMPQLLDHKNHDGWTCLHQAVFAKSIRMIKLIIHISLEKLSDDAMKKFLEHKNDEEKTAFQNVRSLKNQELIDFLQNIKEAFEAGDKELIAALLV